MLHRCPLTVRAGHPAGAGRPVRRGQVHAGPAARRASTRPRTGRITLGGAELSPDAGRAGPQPRGPGQPGAPRVRGHRCGTTCCWPGPDAADAELWAALRRGRRGRLGAGLSTTAWTPRSARAGSSLTPAQAQQIALARLVLADPHTLVLDEATSLLDPRAARHLERSLAGVLDGRTVVAIAHRLHTAHDADVIAVVEDGRISRAGQPRRTGRGRRRRTRRCGAPGTASAERQVGQPQDGLRTCLPPVASVPACEDEAVLTTLLSLPTTMALDVNDEGPPAGPVRRERRSARSTRWRPTGTWRALTDARTTPPGARFVPAAVRSSSSTTAAATNAASCRSSTWTTSGRRAARAHPARPRPGVLPPPGRRQADPDPLHHQPAQRRRLRPGRPRPGDRHRDRPVRRRRLGDRARVAGRALGGAVPGRRARRTRSNCCLVDVTTRPSRAHGVRRPNDQEGGVLAAATRPRSSCRATRTATGWRCAGTTSATRPGATTGGRRARPGRLGLPGREHLLVGPHDGVVSLALHKLADGARVAPLDLPAGGCAALP